jgi:hypothetical protein
MASKRSTAVTGEGARGGVGGCERECVCISSVHIFLCVYVRMFVCNCVCVPICVYMCVCVMEF